MPDHRHLKALEGEPPPAPGGSNGGGGYFNDLSHRVARIETRMENMATKTDIANLKIWVLGGVIGAGIIMLTIGFTIVRIYAPPASPQIQYVPAPIYPPTQE